MPIPQPNAPQGLMAPASNIPTQGPPAAMPSSSGAMPPQPDASAPPVAPKQGFSKGNQQQFDMFMAYCIKVIHSKEVADNIAKSLSGLTDINQQIDHVARLSLDIITRVQTAADQKGQQIGDNVLANALNQVMGEVLNIGYIAGMKKFTDEQKGQSYSLAVSLYLDQAVKTGRLTKEQVQQAAAELSKTKTGQDIGKTREEILAKQGKGKPAAPPPDQQAQAQPAMMPPAAGGTING